MTTQQFLAILSASGIEGADVKVSVQSGPGADEAFERAVTLLGIAGASIDRSRHNVLGGEYEVAVIDESFRLVGPWGRAFQDDERIALTPEAKLALHTVPSGDAA